MNIPGIPLAVVACTARCALAGRTEEIPLADLTRLQLKNVQAESTIYRGAHALKLTEKESATGEAFAIVNDVRFHDGTIDLEVSGAPSKTASSQARGFIGVAFRMQPGGMRFENIYIRPTNGRAEDQLRRNHTTQYVSVPDWPWERLRKESPGPLRRTLPADP